ncbi:MAG: Fe-S cluster assembly protein SufB, partial [Candidatus Thiodiazotropha sp.]
MGLPDTQMEELIKSDYAQGFITQIESDTLPPGLDESVVRTISERKGEPEWMLEKRLLAYRHWLTMSAPNWAAIRHPPIDFQAISYYSSPKKKPLLESLDEVDPELLATYEKLGIPLDEQKA